MSSLIYCFLCQGLAQCSVWLFDIILWQGWAIIGAEFTSNITWGENNSALHLFSCYVSFRQHGCAVVSIVTSHQEGLGFQSQLLPSCVEFAHTHVFSLCMCGVFSWHSGFLIIDLECEWLSVLVVVWLTVSLWSFLFCFSSFSIFFLLTANSSSFSDMPQPTPPFLLSLHATQLSYLLPLFLPPLELALLNGGENPAYPLPAALFFFCWHTVFWSFVLFHFRPIARPHSDRNKDDNHLV